MGRLNDKQYFRIKTVFQNKNAEMKKMERKLLYCNINPIQVGLWIVHYYLVALKIFNMV